MCACGASLFVTGDFLPGGLVSLFRGGLCTMDVVMAGRDVWQRYGRG